jgi:hypothetical protein
MDKYERSDFSPTRKPDRKIYRETIEKLASQLPGVTIAVEFLRDSKAEEYHCRLTHTSGFMCFFSVLSRSGNTTIVHWCPAREQQPTRKLADTFSQYGATSVNQYHRQKATDQVGNLIALISLLSNRFLALEDGTAFLPEETAADRKLRERARREIERETTLVHDICSNTGQMLANVKQTQWLLNEVMAELKTMQAR